MLQTALGEVLDYLRRSCAVQEALTLPDGELLERILSDRQDAAFAAIVHRHGPLVLSVCQRVLGDVHAAEDAFQATFMVLMRRAPSLRREPLGNWLYAVAQRIALRARAQSAARRDRERRLDNMPRAEPLDDVTLQELRSVLDEEIGRLTKQHQAAIVLCYLQGKSYDEAAKELGCPKSTLASRLERARDVLRVQLVKRGIALSTGVLTTALAEKARAAPVAALLTINTIKAVTGVVAGKAGAASCLRREP